MKEFIVAETQKMFTKGLLNYTKKYDKAYNELYLLLYLKKEDEVGYQIYVYDQMQEEIDLKQFLGVKMIDLKGYTVLAPPYILGFLKDFCKELSSNKVEVCVYLDEDMSDVRLFLFDSGKMVKEIFLDNLINV